MKWLQSIPPVAKDGAPEAEIWRSFDGYLHGFWATGVGDFLLYVSAAVKLNLDTKLRCA